MEYTLFDQMTASSSRNQIIACLNKEALTTDEIAEKVELDRTSVTYHLGILFKQKKVRKANIKKFVYYGLVENERKLFKK